MSSPRALNSTSEKPRAEMRLKSQRLQDLVAYERKLRESHQDSLADLVSYVMGECGLVLQECLDEPLTITQAREWGGYTCSQLNRLVKGWAHPHQQ